MRRAGLRPHERCDPDPSASSTSRNNYLLYIRYGSAKPDPLLGLPTVGVAALRVSRRAAAMRQGASPRIVSAVRAGLVIGFRRSGCGAWRTLVDMVCDVAAVRAVRSVPWASTPPQRQPPRGCRSGCCANGSPSGGVAATRCWRRCSSDPGPRFAAEHLNSRRCHSNTVGRNEPRGPRRSRPPSRMPTGGA